MNPPSAPQWSTASFGESAQTSPMELHVLGTHLGQCATSSGRLFGARCVAEALHGFVASRLVTSLAVVAMLALAGASML